MRKYLDDIGVTDRPENLKGDHKSSKTWQQERKIYGFDERETWNLDYSFYLWLYERLKMYIKVASAFVDLNYHQFEYDGEKYTQLQMINLMLERLEFLFSPEYDDWNRTHVEYILEIPKIWAIVLPSMWI